MRIASMGHAVFAVTLIVLGLMGFVSGDFAPIWDSIPKGLPGRQALIYLCSFICLACGAGLIIRRSATVAARALLIYMLLWLLLVKGRFIVLAPLVEGSYQTSGETAVIAAAAWVLYARLADDWDRKHLSFAVGARGIRIAQVLYGLALIAFGLSHFAYLELTAPLVPKWLPGPVFWSYSTGAAYCAAGVALVLGICARIAAVLAALQIALLTFLVWTPILAAGHVSAQHWVETVVSWVLTVAAWVMAESIAHASMRASFSLGHPD
jgi:uncharacterized membrane protein